MHPDHVALKQYALGQLPEDSAAELQRHVALCADCDATLCELETIEDTLVGRLRRGLPDDPLEAEPGCQRLVAEIGQLNRSVIEPYNANHEDSGELAAETLIREYRLLGKLGHGGMGTVYKAVHTRLDKVVALKVLPRNRLTEPAAIDRFQREMRAVGKLAHRHIVAAHDAGEFAGWHYLVMELVEGINLSDLVRQTGPLGIAEACELVRQAALGLQHAHERGLIHRDIKPSNLMLADTEDGPLIKILDLGLALLDEGPLAAGELTSSGMVMGTLDYMAPEQAADTHRVDTAADIYSLGATLFKLLAGRAPLELPELKSPIKKLAALATQQRPRLDALRGDVPPALADLVAAMLAAAPTDRPTPPAEVARRLAPFAASAELSPLARLRKQQSLPETILMDADALAHAREAATSPTALDDTDRLAGSKAVASAPIAAAAPIAVTHAKPNRRRGPRRWAAVLAGLAAVVLLGITYYVRTNRGTLEITVNDPAVETRLGASGLQIVDTRSNKTYRIALRKPQRLPAGAYRLADSRLEIVGDSGLKVTGDSFELARGDQVRIKIRAVPLTGGVAAAERGKTSLSAVDRHASHTPSAHGDNYALTFDGDDFVRLPKLPFPGGRQPFTVELLVWNTPELWRGASELLNVHGGRVRIATGGGMIWFRIWEEREPKQFFERDLIARLPEIYPQNRWLHIAGVYDGSEMRLYLDGVLYKGVETSLGPSVSPGDDSSQTAPNLAGLGGLMPPWYQDAYSEARINGALDEVRISLVDRYRENFPPPMRLESDEHTIALYHCDEGKGDVLRDASPHNHHGTIVGASWAPHKSPPVTRRGFALAFLDDPYLSVPGLTFDGSSPQTWEATVVAQRGGTEMPVFSNMQNGAGFALDYSDMADERTRWRIRAGRGDGTFWSAQSEPIHPFYYQLFHVALVYDVQQLRLYVNGKETARCDIDDPPATSEAGLRIGSLEGKAPFFRGRIDEIRISRTARYDRDFTPPGRFEVDDDCLALYHCDDGQGTTVSDSTPNKYQAELIGPNLSREWVSYGTGQ
jgi:serine/threonine protein kinase